MDVGEQGCNKRWSGSRGEIGVFPPGAHVVPVQACPQPLEVWTDRVLDAGALEEVFQAC